jgi:pyruvate kinase
LIAARRTKIVATIGPASEERQVLRALVDAGMDVARFSLSHAPLEATLARIDVLRDVAADAGRHIGVLADLPGPKIRAAEVEGDGVLLAAGQQVDLVVASPGMTSTATRIGVDAPVVGLEPGDHVALGDGAIRLVVEQAGERVEARVATGGWIQGRPGVLLPPDRSPLAAPTDEDLRLLEGLVDAGVDAVAVSFVRTAADIDAARAVRPDALLIAKIETAEAVADLDAIVATADGVMVARGDLGLRCAIEDVPHHQKRIIRTGVAFARPVITATQMLESMIRSPVPTRAEVSDIANAVFDGTSALMLSGETAIGHDPPLAVATMARIAVRAERDFDHEGWGHRVERLQSRSAELPTGLRLTGAVSAAGWRAALDADLSAIIACTNSGATARAISRFRPRVPVIAATPSSETARALSMAWGITALVTDRHGTTDDIVWFAVKAVVDAGLVQPGTVVGVLVGSPTEPGPVTDTLRLVQVS